METLEVVISSQGIDFDLRALRVNYLLIKSALRLCYSISKSRECIMYFKFHVFWCMEYLSPKLYGLTSVKALLWGPNNRVILTS